MFLIRGLVKIIIFGLIIILGIVWLGEQGSPNPRTMTTTIETTTEEVQPLVVMTLNFQNIAGEPAVATQAYMHTNASGQLYELTQCVGVATCTHQAQKNELVTFTLVIEGCSAGVVVNNALLIENNITLTVKPNSSGC